MNFETKFAIYQAHANQLSELVEKASEGSLLRHEGEQLKVLFYDFMNINNEIFTDLHKGHLENYETQNEALAKLIETFNIVAEIAGDAIGQEIPEFKGGQL